MANEFDRLKAALAARYQVHQELGRGGMATVYHAYDLRHDRAVAVKVLKPDLAAALGPERFLREITLTARLDHPHILPLLDSGDAEGFLYYVMPYVEGESLRDRLNREKQLPLHDAVQIAREVADALSYAHSHNVVHRDIKPENILLSAGHARVADFGIARAVEAAGGETLTKVTATGIGVGTPIYMSPEQAVGDRALDARSDIYSLACVVYEMLAGQPPFSAATAQAILVRKSLEAVPGLRVVREAVPPAIEEAITRALARVPADRFTTASQFAEALAAAVGTVPTPATGVAPPTPGKRPLFIKITAGTAIAVLAVAAYIALKPGDPTPVDAVPRLVVLPFENLGAAEDEYFADGMTDEITARLAQVTGLAVIARQSAMLYKGSGKTPEEIGAELDADFLLEATVSWQRALDGTTRVRIRPQLIRATDASHVWADVLDEDLTEVFVVQTRIATRVAEALNVVLVGSERRSLGAVPTASIEAHDHYLRGRFHWAKRTAEGLWVAIQHFERATAIDPDYALAYAGLADTYAVLPWYDADVTPAELHGKAQLAADRALALDPASPKTRTARGYAILMARSDFEEAEREFRRAIELDPRYAAAHHWLADLLSYRSRLVEAIAAERQALNVDPLSIVSTENLGHILTFDRQYPEAAIQLEKAIELDPARPGAWFGLAWALLLADSTDHAGRAFERWAALAGADPRHFTRLPALVSQHRRTSVPVPLPEEIYRAPQLSLMDRARLSALVGDRERAFELLEQLVRERWPHALEIRIDPSFDSLQEDPRFRELQSTIR